MPELIFLQGVDNLPTYDFRCRNCGHEFTVRVSIKEKSKTRCPVCQQMDLKQLFTGINISGVGSGGINDCGPAFGRSGSRFT
ncbi:MAG: FmdB family zinc ribbon protein [Bacillota bacterium]